MRISMLQDNLNNALKLAKYTVKSSRRNTLPVLECVKIGTANSRVTIETTDLDTAVRIHKGGIVEEDGAICIPYKEFAKFTALLSPERIDLEVVQRTLSLHMACGASKAEFKGIDAQDFPVIHWPSDNEANDNPTIMIRADILAEMLQEVQYAASEYEDRPALNAVCFEYDTDTLKLVASDGYRMACATHKFESPSFDGKLSAVVPLAAIEKFKALFALEINSAEDVYLCFDGLHLCIIAPLGVEYMITLTEGQFPAYETIYFDNTLYTTRVDPVSLLTQLRRAAVFSPTADMVTEVQENGLGIMRIGAKSTELGTTEGVVDVRIHDDTIKSYYKNAFLNEALNTIGDREIVLDFKLASPAIANGTNYILKITDGTTWHLLMPEFIRRNGE